MARYIATRLVQLLPTLLGISIAVFLVMRVVPGDPALAMLGEQADPARLAQVRSSLGLDQPLYLQYFYYMKDALIGDLGHSILNNRPVINELLLRFPATLELTVSALSIGLILGLIMGVVAATRRGGILDALTMSVSLAGISMPVFWLGLVLIWIFSVNAGWLPVSGRISSDLMLETRTHFMIVDAMLAGNLDALLDVLRHLILPAVTLSTITMATVARMTRSSMLEVLSDDFVRTGRAKGLRELHIILRHVLRNALIPVLTIVGLQFGRLLGGAIVTETIFSWPGVGRFVLEGVLGRDYPVVQGSVLIITIVFALVNLLVDISYAVIDPRIRIS